MSQTPDSDQTGEQHSSVGSSSRRTFMKAAAAGTTAAGIGATGITGSVSAEPIIPTPPLSVEGNTFVDPEGNTVTLRGVNMIDPRRADVLAPTRGKNAVQMVDMLTDRSDGWETQVVRVPLQPSDIAEDSTGYADGPQTPGDFSEADLEEYLEEHVDDVVNLCEQRGVYVILDYHRHWQDGEEWDGWWADDQGNPHEGLQDEVVMFWDVVGQRYGDRDHTLWEVYNEPTQPGMWGDPIDSFWDDEWWDFVDFIQPCVDQIEEHTDRPILLGSPSWTQSPEGILLEGDDQLDEPENLAMTYHIYSGHDVSTSGDDWSGVGPNGDGVQEVYQEYPLVVTEFGWDYDLMPHTEDNPLGGTTESFGEPFIDWMESGDREDSVSWTAWCADIWWDPTMFDPAFDQTPTDFENPYEEDIPEDCPDTPCEWDLLGEDAGDYDENMGAYVKEQLDELSDHNNPAGEITTPDPCEEHGADGEELENGDWVCDLDGDGNYRDVTASGDATTQDLQHFFENQHQDPWNSRTDLFDFTGNDDVGQPDVVDLFHAI